MNLLVGDIGGTKTILALFSTEKGPCTPVVEKNYPSQQFAAFQDMVHEFLNEIKEPVHGASIGVAGPAIDMKGWVTNLEWDIDGRKLQSEFGWSSVVMFNDVKAVANAIPILEKEDIFTLNTGKPEAKGSIAVIAPGTGLGESFLAFNGSSYHAYPTEGSHASFAPVGALQIGLLQYMFRQGFDHVSVERVCSGRMGIPSLYAYLKEIGFEEPVWLAEKLAAVADPAPVIFAAALDTSLPCALAKETLDLFVAILGAEAGNLALRVFSTGGVYLGGGISPRIITELEKPTFLEAFRSKGRFRQILTDMPVHVILNTRAGLLGAAVAGLRMADC